MTRRSTRPLVTFCVAVAPLLLSASPAGPSKTHDKKTVTKPTLYVVGYAHLDTQWCWTYPQVVREFLANTLHENFALFDKYPDYTFNFTGSNRYRFFKQYYPEDYAKLKKYIAQGRWFPAGSSVEEGDVNAPSSESLIRQVLYGNEFFRDEFGVASDEYMLPDCFGFPASLPSILAHCGIKGFSTQKLTWGSAVGVPFEVGNWVGPDGKGVVAALDAFDYGSKIDDDLTHDQYWIDRMMKKVIDRDGVPADYRYYGTGDRGGSPGAPSAANLEKSLHGDGPLKIVAGRADQMFNDLSPDQIAKLPTYKGDLELTQHSAGSPTSEAAMKRWNRKNELLADDAERASVAADWVHALPYDKARLTDAWLRFLPGQFHDLMAGTALPLAYNYTWNDEIIALNEFAGVLQESVGGVARGLDTRGPGLPVVVYNPISTARKDVVEATVRFPAMRTGSLSVTGPDGRVVPSQVISREGISATILFEASAPSVGFAVYHVAPSTSDGPTNSLRVTNDSLENRRYRVRLDANGDVASVFDKSIGKELLAAPARLVYMHENPTNWPAWNMDWSDQSKPPASVVTGPAKVEIIENGPVRVALRVTREHDGSKFVQDIRLSDGDSANRLEFATNIDWHGKETALKAEFPLSASNPKATYNWGIGTIQRGNDDPRKYEVVSHGWSDVTNPSGDFGSAILDDSKYASDKPNDNTMRLTLLYTPGTHGGYQHQGTQDWGHHEMIYALEGHAGQGQVGTQWQTLELNQPMIAFATTAHEGKLGKTFSLVHVSSDRIAIEALKKAEKGDATVVRFNELSGEGAKDVRVRFAAPVISATEVDGQERPIGPGTVQNGELVFSTTAYHPRAYAVKLANSGERLGVPRSHPIALSYNVDGVSTWAHKTDGDFDGKGKTLPGELLPATLMSDGVEFRLGPTGDRAKNALVPDGQTLSLPPGKRRRIYFLASSIDGDSSIIVNVSGPKGALVTNGIYVQAWDGFIGQWDNRLWDGKVPELTYSWSNPLGGLVPGFIKRDTVAWYADHRRLANGTNDIYSFCYLFRYDLPVPDDATSIRLARNPKVRIMAATVAENRNDDTYPLTPLYDTLQRTNTAPGIEVQTMTGAPVTEGQTLNNTVAVTFGRPEYWSEAQPLRYTLDGSEPTAQSAVAGNLVYLSKSATLKVAQFDGDRQTSPTTSEQLAIEDTTPPAVQSVLSVPFDAALRIRFSEPVERASAESVANYQLSPATEIRSVSLSPDGRTATLLLASPLPTAGDYTISVSGVRDLSPAANPTSGAGVPVERLQPVFSSADVQDFKGRRGVTQRNVPNLPVHGGEPWTLNVFANADTETQNLTILAGFGDGGDNNGAERYFVVHEGAVEFWGSDIDISMGKSLERGRWQMLTATFDGHDIRLYMDGKLVKTESTTLQDAVDTVRLAPPPAWSEGHRYTGKLSGLTIWNQALPPAAVQALAAARPSN